MDRIISRKLKAPPSAKFLGGQCRYGNDKHPVGATVGKAVACHNHKRARRGCFGGVDVGREPQQGSRRRVRRARAKFNFNGDVGAVFVLDNGVNFGAGGITVMPNPAGPFRDRHPVPVIPG